jgi:hypothetical protein
MNDTRHTIDTITAEALEQLYAELDRIRTTAERYLRNGCEALEQANWRAYAAETQLEHQQRAHASTILEARRQASRARDYEASAKRLYAECLRVNRVARSAAKDAKDALGRQLAVEDAINRGLYVAEVIDANGIAWAASSIRKALTVEADR